MANYDYMASAEGPEIGTNISILSTHENLKTFWGFLHTASKLGRARLPTTGRTWTNKTHKCKGWLWAESDQMFSPSGKGTKV